MKSDNVIKYLLRDTYSDELRYVEGNSESEVRLKILKYVAENDSLWLSFLDNMDFELISFENIQTL